MNGAVVTGLTQAQAFGVLGGFLVGLADYFIVVHMIGQKIMDAANAPGATEDDRVKAENGMAWLKIVMLVIGVGVFPAIGYYFAPALLS